MSETTDQELSSFIVVARIANYSGHAVWRKLLALTADLVTHLRWGFHFLHLNTVNALIGAPVVLWVILRRKNATSLEL